MRGYVSVPEKTLEHWSSQYINSRFSTQAALWWPAKGDDIKVGWLPARPGKVVQLELKTTIVTGSTSHEVKVDLGQLEEYRQRRLGYQPFYVFPWPDWHGKLEDEAAAWGRAVTELAFSRSGSGWWFAHWMVAMTTRQVAAVLDAELKRRHGSIKRGKTASLVHFEVKIPGTKRERETKATWGPGRKEINPSPVINWADLWTELKSCGRPEWPQLIRLPKPMIGADRTYSYDHLLQLLRDIPPGLSKDQLNQEIPFVTLEPDDEGNYLVTPITGADLSETAANAADEEAEDHRIVVFLGTDKDKITAA